MFLFPRLQVFSILNPIFCVYNREYINIATLEPQVQSEMVLHSFSIRFMTFVEIATLDKVVFWLNPNLCTSVTCRVSITLKAVVAMVNSRVMRKRRMKVRPVLPMLSSSASIALFPWQKSGCSVQSLFSGHFGQNAGFNSSMTIFYSCSCVRVATLIRIRSE